MDRRRTPRQINMAHELTTLPLPSLEAQAHLEEQTVRLSPLMELTIVGGLGVFIMIAPNVAALMKQGFQHVKTRIIVLKDRLGHAKITKKLEVLNRRRKFGSVVRVIGSLLPGSVFTPPCRIYIPNWAHLEKLNPQHEINLTLLNGLKKPDLPSENDVGDGLIEAFEIDSEVTSTVSEDDDEEIDASSNPEGWVQEPLKFVGNFNPTLMNLTDSSFARCSTPRGNVEDLHFNASHIFNQQSSKVYEDQADIVDLQKMVEGLMLQINCLNQSLLTTQNQLAAQQSNPVHNTIQSRPMLEALPTIVPAPAGLKLL